MCKVLWDVLFSNLFWFSEDSTPEVLISAAAVFCLNVM